MIINVIQNIKGGGAEILIRDLHRFYLGKNINVYSIYFSGEEKNLEKNEILFQSHPKSPLNIFRLRRTLKKIYKKNNKKMIINAHLTSSFFFTVIATIGLKNIKLIFTKHSTLNNQYNIPFYKIIENLFYQRYFYIVCISQGVYNSLQKWVSKNILTRLEVIHNGAKIFPLVNRTTLAKRLPNLVSVGSLTKIKNFSTMINAVGKLRNKIECYTIVGEGPERIKLEKIIKKEKLENKIKIVGWSNNVEKYYHAADIQIIPSIYEGFSLVAIEGMSTGLPVVASNIDGLKEIVNETNSSVIMVNKVKSIVEWEEAILKCINNIEKVGSNTLSKISRKQAEKFALKQMAIRYLNLYDI